MSDVPHAWLLRFLKVDPEPQLPEGTMRVFRAAPQYLLYRRVLLGFKHVVAVVGAVVAWAFLSQMLAPMLRGLPATTLVTTLIYAVEVVAWLGFLVLVLPLSFFVVRLDYELRWYALTDRSLRVREGVMSLREKTMTFANIQQISIQQNPVQRVLGIADVKVETAGGGSGSRSRESDTDMQEHLHEARFRGVSNPEAIRDAIMECVRQHRDTGLGEPSELATSPEPTVAPAPSTLEAAHEVLAEVRALRGTLAERPAARATPRAS
ncbi:PH domain-containing protein [Myxococcus sp. CA033]|uniref:PH domain-containing protein n=1 Tax=Myxococcus sp. CA033 TaxID=2741516 RepID=UPI00157AF673|nr:PH domain-containing protein [Myxococcus sp. CA033]NTX35290.1 PH domain-containing protein [Myxococcus sp. CA033]